MYDTKVFIRCLFSFLTLLPVLLESPLEASASPCQVRSDKKVALVIGNSYSGDQRVSGVKDAGAMSTHLHGLGFSVTTVLDGRTDDILEALKCLRANIASAETVIFFFSGHGYQIDDANYLLPYDTEIDPEKPQIPVAKVVNSLAGAPDTAVKLVLLDACRTTADLPVEGNRKLADLPKWAPGLNEPSADRPLKMVFGYAADYEQPAVSGPPNGFSPYSSALLRSIREPGLQIKDLFARVNREVFEGTNGSQNTQSKGLDEIGEFYLAKPVYVSAAIPPGYSDLLVLLNGEIVLDSSQKREGLLRLKADENNLLLLVSSGKTFRNGQSWERTEGWDYRFDLTLPDGSKVLFEDSEEVPFKNGPHHGKVFPVAQAKIIVNPASAKTTLPPESRDDTIWNRDTPLWAQNQDLLYEKSIKDLPIKDILDPEKFPNLPNFGIVPSSTVLALLRDILTTGKFLGQGVADPAQTFFVVRGNMAFKELVTACVEPKINERIQDVRVSLEAALKRLPRPFDSFDLALTNCIQKAAGAGGSSLPLNDFKVWTAIEDRSGDRQPSPVAALPTPPGQTDVMSRVMSTESGGRHE